MSQKRGSNMNEYKIETIFFVSVVTIIIGFACLTLRKGTCEMVNVVEIGGCNQYACGVRLDDGRAVSLSRPVLGLNERCDK